MYELWLKETINTLDVDVKKHERLPNIALRHKFKVKVQRYYFCSTFKVGSSTMSITHTCIIVYSPQSTRQYGVRTKTGGLRMRIRE
jgi:hypothetical protein